jgi:hypothetical protein
VARLFCAGPAHRDRIDRFEVAGIRNKVHVDGFAGRSRVRSRRTNVILYVASAEHAARIHVFKSGNHFMRRLARGMDHHV